MRIKKQLSLLAVIFVFSIVFQLFCKSSVCRTVLLISKMGKSLRVIQVYNYLRSLPFYHYLLLSFYYLHFTYFMIVLGITRQGLGVMNLPPNLVVDIILSLFTMRPVLGQLKSDVWIR